MDERQKACISILESNLKDIISPFSRRLVPLYLNLAPEEMEVANLVRHGKTTKQIAEFLTLSTQTIDYHRKNIRNKLRIRNRKIASEPIYYPRNDREKTYPVTTH